MRCIKKLFISVSIVLLCCIFVSSALANPISEIIRSKAKADLKRDLLNRYGSSYSTVEMLLKAGMRDYDTLCTIPDNSVNNGILRELKQRYYPSFSAILMLFKANKKSYNNLNK